MVAALGCFLVSAGEDTVAGPLLLLKEAKQQVIKRPMRLFLVGVMFRLAASCLVEVFTTECGLEVPKITVCDGLV